MTTLAKYLSDRDRCKRALSALDLASDQDATLRRELETEIIALDAKIAVAERALSERSDQVG